MPTRETKDYCIYHGDCTEILLTIPSASVDLVFTDPPYPCINRHYGKLSESEWFDIMHQVMPELRRILKPSGSAVFVLQANSAKLGRMRTWLWEFMVWVGKEWGIVQDVYWMNTTPIPVVHSTQGGLMRPCVKSLVWCGKPDCYRNQDQVLWEKSF